MNEDQINFKLYSLEFSNKEAIKNNFFLSFMYGCSYPFSYIFMKMRLTPNMLTWLSITCCIVACYYLFIKIISLFILFWSLSILFDFCDGTLARMTKNTRKTLLRFDHFSDLCKFSMIILFLAIYYNEYFYWVMSFICSFFYMFYTVLDHDVVNLIIKNKSDNEVKSSRLRDNFGFIKYITENQLLFSISKIVIPFITINGHTLLLFILMPLDMGLALIALSYLIILTLIGINLRLGVLKSSYIK